jgi:hypothetical protein
MPLSDAQVIARLRQGDEEDALREQACLAELQAHGLLEEGFGARTLLEWLNQTKEILVKHGYQVPRPWTMKRR